jgi:DNA primase
MDLTNVDVLDFLEALGIRNITDGGDEIQYSCPFPVHGYGDSTPSAYMNTETTAFFCHSCKARGNAIHFLAMLEGISPLLAAQHIRNRYGDGFLEPTEGFQAELESLLQKQTTKKLPSANQPIDYSMQLLSGEALEYMRGRGFKDDTLESWQICYDQISNRIAIPVRDKDGVLIGFKGRAYLPNHNPKYLVLGDKEGRGTRYGFPTYDVANVVFGLDRVDHSIDSLILVEGELNVLALDQHGMRNAVAVGSNFGDTKRDLILDRCDSVCLFLDDDPAGRVASKKIAEALSPYISVLDVGPHEGDPATLTAEECGILISRATNTLTKILPEN